MTTRWAEELEERHKLCETEREREGGVDGENEEGSD